MKKIFYIAILLLSTNLLHAQNNATLQIKDALNKQVVDWNNGNIDSFMQTYWKNDSLLFIGKNGVTYGWQQTMNNYKKGYPDTAAMGKLNFTVLQVKKIDTKNYFVVGKWYLTRSIGNVGGHFTLIWKKIKNKWQIVADHSS
jgi:hypothetical protein